MNDLEKFNTLKANNYVTIVFKEIILCQNINQKIHVSKMIVLQSTI